MELYIEPVKPTVNRVTGQFLKGHEPFNKGRKWADYLPEEKIAKMKKQILSLSGQGRTDIDGCYCVCYYHDKLRIKSDYQLIL